MIALDHDEFNHLVADSPSTQAAIDQVAHQRVEENAAARQDEEEVGEGNVDFVQDVLAQRRGRGGEGELVHDLDGCEPVFPVALADRVGSAE